MAEQVIKIGLKYDGQVYDLQVARKTSLKALVQQLPAALAVVGVRLPLKFHLQLCNKALVIDENEPLQVYALGNGDQFEVIEEKKENDEDK